MVDKQSMRNVYKQRRNWVSKSYLPGYKLREAEALSVLNPQLRKSKQLAEWRFYWISHVLFAVGLQRAIAI